jgi:hypothetical protein
MPRKNSTGDGRATRIPAEPEAEQIIALLDADATTPGQRNVLTAALRELSDGTGVKLPKPDADPRDFYLEAAYRLGAAGPRARLREALRLITEGERFDDYKAGDHLWLWKQKRARRNHSNTRTTAAELAARLSDPKTPADYRAALKRALRVHCATVGTKYDAKDPAETYAAAEAEGEKFHVIRDRDEWCVYSDARCNVLELLRCLKKRVPLADVTLRGPRRPKAEGKRDDLPPRLRSLRNALRLLREEGEAHNESGVFRLEREIYDLEHADTTPADDWPEWIPG